MFGMDGCYTQGWTQTGTDVGHYTDQLFDVQWANGDNRRQPKLCKKNGIFETNEFSENFLLMLPSSFNLGGSCFIDEADFPSDSVN